MATYTCYSDLIGKGLLEERDRLYFKINWRVLEYDVCDSFLNHCWWDNDEIFTELGISQKYTFCSSIYGYEVNSGSFPSSRMKDFEALTKIALALFDIIEFIDQGRPSTWRHFDPVLHYITGNKYKTTCEQVTPELSDVKSSTITADWISMQKAKKEPIKLLSSFPTTIELVTAINALIEAHNKSI